MVAHSTQIQRHEAFGQPEKLELNNSVPSVGQDKHILYDTLAATRRRPQQASKGDKAVEEVKKRPASWPSEGRKKKEEVEASSIMLGLNLDASDSSSRSLQSSDR